MVLFCFGVHCMNVCFNRSRRGPVPAGKHTVLLGCWRDTEERGRVLCSHWRDRHCRAVTLTSTDVFYFFSPRSFRVPFDISDCRLDSVPDTLLARDHSLQLVHTPFTEDKVYLPGTLKKNVSRMKILKNLINILYFFNWLPETECLCPPKSTYWSLKTQCGGICRWSLWEVIRSRGRSPPEWD